MPFHVSLIQGEINFETLPVAKITNYPLEKADYKPFAQCSMCISQEKLWLQMLAFEVYTSPKSELRAVFYLFEDKNLALHISATADDPVSVNAWIDGLDLSIPVSATPYNGEDLQGVYWGVQLSVSLSALEKHSPLCSLLAGKAFPANFYKLRNDANYAHMGSFFPAKFPENPFDIESMGTFTLISY